MSMRLADGDSQLEHGLEGVEIVLSSSVQRVGMVMYSMSLPIMFMSHYGVGVGGWDCDVQQLQELGWGEGGDVKQEHGCWGVDQQEHCSARVG